MKSLWRCGSDLKPGKSFLAVTTKTSCHLDTWSSKIPFYMLRDEQRECQCISRTCNAPIPWYHSWVVSTVLEKRNCSEQCFWGSDELCVLGLALALAGNWRVIFLRATAVWFQALLHEGMLAQECATLARLDFKDKLPELQEVPALFHLPGGVSLVLQCQRQDRRGGEKWPRVISTKKLLTCIQDSGRECRKFVFPVLPEAHLMKRP